MPTPRHEQETTVTFIKSDKLALCWTSDPIMAKKWRKLGYDVSIFGQLNGNAVSWNCTVPFKKVSFRKLTSSKRASLTVNLIPHHDVAALTNHENHSF